MRIRNSQTVAEIDELQLATNQLRILSVRAALHEQVVT